MHLLSRCGGWHVQELLNLNLAINQIRTIENLEGCESLEKLDLTLNQVSACPSTPPVHYAHASASLQALLCPNGPDSTRCHIAGASKALDHFPAKFGLNK